LTKGLFLRFNKSKLYSREVYRIAFQTILLSLVYRNTKVLSDYLADLIKKNKQHHKTLRTFVSGIERFFFSNTLKLLGLQLRVTGKLGGRMRKSKYHYSLGKVQLQTIRMGVSYTLGISYTKFGVISIKT
jgi:ribosomal protein S3